ncbi:flavin reductase family protein [Streptomyces sp. NPDC048258]|uniref:flavin reductase family protein n=1 Tax=Streptomyces sp. NPDC048258 TaxID=3365527 RepID=UPI00371DDB38
MNTTESAVQDLFKEVMSCVATPVSIVTVMSDGDLPFGATVSAFSSLSIDPAMLLIALDRRSKTLEVIRESGRFGLNVLGADQDDLAMAFAAKGGVDKFYGTSWSVDCGLPRIAHAPAWIASTVVDLVDGGDHVIVLGRVDAAESTGDKAPLVYYRRSFGTHLPHYEPV